MDNSEKEIIHAAFADAIKKAVYRTQEEFVKEAGQFNPMKDAKKISGRALNNFLRSSDSQMFVDRGTGEAIMRMYRAYEEIKDKKALGEELKKIAGDRAEARYKLQKIEEIVSWLFGASKSISDISVSQVLVDISTKLQLLTMSLSNEMEKSPN